MFHDPNEARAFIASLTPKQWQDGILVDCPKQRRRHQAMGLKRLQIVVDRDIQKRMATQINRYVELCVNKGLAWDIMCRLLEKPTDDELRSWTEP